MMDKNLVKDLSFQACLGLGSYGIVFAAQNETPNQDYAVTVVCKDSSLSKREQLGLDRESQLARQLTGHRNIVRVLDVVEKSYTHAELEELWRPSLARNVEQHARRDTILGKAKRDGSIRLMLFQMEVCGNTLRHWLRDESTHKLNPDDLHHAQFNILRNFAEGIKFLHRNNIIHRDIKPENAMFSGPQTRHEYAFPLKVGDFGLCRLFHNTGIQLSTLTSKVGTPDYMAPEVLRGKYEQQCDIYSFGLVAWEVAQLIPCNTRRVMFDALENDQDYNAIQEHSAFAGMKVAIITMTMRTTHDRMRSLDDFHLSYNATKRLMCDHVKNADTASDPTTNRGCQVPSGDPMPDDADDAEFLKRWANTSIHSIRVDFFAPKLKMYWHNLPDTGRDELLVTEIVQAAGIPGVAEINLKREEHKVSGWWNYGVASLAWNKKKHDTIKPLKVK